MKRITLTAGVALLAATITIGYVGASGHPFAPKAAPQSASSSQSALAPTADQVPAPSAADTLNPSTSQPAGLVPVASGGGSAGDSASTPASAASASASAAANSDNAQALETLNSFYKPALKGQFPGAAAGLTVGESTRQDVHDAIGEPPSPGEDSDAFDVYHAEMGHPGYAVSYKLNRIREIRYFGTNVESQTNIGGITLHMLEQHWGEPSSTKTIQNGKLVQTKVVYNRGDYALSFIFNDDADLDHINLTEK